jgi:large subunit ribosomal protein L6
MSRIGKKPVPVPGNVKVAVSGRTITVEGPKGKLDWTFHPDMTVRLDGEANQVVVERPSDQRRHKALHGLTRALVANMVEGVVNGYERPMELYGTGYSANVQGRELVIQCGFAHEVRKAIPAGVEVEVAVPNTRGNDTPARFVVRGCDKQAVGEFAAEVRSIRPPEPYLGKGFRYAGEPIRRKAGKTFVGGGAG